jgi:hypothetical protein
VVLAVVEMVLVQITAKVLLALLILVVVVVVVTLRGRAPLVVPVS